MIAFIHIKTGEECHAWVPGGSQERTLSKWTGAAGFTFTRLCVEPGDRAKNIFQRDWTKAVAKPFVEKFCAAGERLEAISDLSDLVDALNNFAMRRNLASKTESSATEKTEQQLVRMRSEVKAVQEQLDRERKDLVSLCSRCSHVAFTVLSRCFRTLRTLRYVFETLRKNSRTQKVGSPTCI